MLGEPAAGRTHPLANSANSTTMPGPSRKTSFLSW